VVSPIVTGFPSSASKLNHFRIDRQSIFEDGGRFLVFCEASDTENQSVIGGSEARGGKSANSDSKFELRRSSPRASAAFAWSRALRRLCHSNPASIEPDGEEERARQGKVRKDRAEKSGVLLRARTDTVSWD